MNPVVFFIRLFVLIIATLIALRILFVLVHRLPGVVVALSTIALLSFSIAYYKGGWQAIGLRNRKSSALAALASAILLIVSFAILIHLK